MGPKGRPLRVVRSPKNTSQREVLLNRPPNRTEKKRRGGKKRVFPMEEGAQLLPLKEKKELIIPRKRSLEGGCGRKHQNAREGYRKNPERLGHGEEISKKTVGPTVGGGAKRFEGLSFRKHLLLIASQKNRQMERLDPLRPSWWAQVKTGIQRG